MADINTDEYGAWERGSESGFEDAMDILKVSKILIDKGFDPERILLDELNEIEEAHTKYKVNGVKK